MAKPTDLVQGTLDLLILKTISVLLGRVRFKRPNVTSALGCTQRLSRAVNDKLGIEPKGGL
jgi:hypothetical protein